MQIVYIQIYVPLMRLINMINVNDFRKKQIIFIFANHGDKVAFNNENLVIYEKIQNISCDKLCNEEINSEKTKIKFQVSLYRLFLVYIIGDLSITTVIIKKARQYGFFIALLSSGFKLYDVIGAKKDGNTLLIDKQFKYEGLEIAKYIVGNKVRNQQLVLKNIREKDELLKKAISILDSNLNLVEECKDFYTLLSIEGNSAKLYFKELYKQIGWNGRKPRVKTDIINTTLDIGYTILFSFIEVIVSSFGFNLYRGVLHKQFYMRKSLICDLIEPFRPIIDYQIRKSYNLGEIREKDFLITNHQYKLKWEENKKYVSFIFEAIIDYKEYIFKYVQSYYRYFMKENYMVAMPDFVWGSK